MSFVINGESSFSKVCTSSSLVIFSVINLSTGRLTGKIEDIFCGSILSMVLSDISKGT